MISNRLLRLAFQGVSALAVVLSAAAPSLGDGMPDPVVLPAKLTMPQAAAISGEHGIDLLIADAAILSARADERAAGAIAEPNAHSGCREELRASMRWAGLRLLDGVLAGRPRSRSPASAGRTAYARDAGEAAVRASGARGRPRSSSLRGGRADQQSDALARPDSFQSPRRLSKPTWRRSSTRSSKPIKRWSRRQLLRTNPGGLLGTRTLALPHDVDDTFLHHEVSENVDAGSRATTRKAALHQRPDSPEFAQEARRGRDSSSSKPPARAGHWPLGASTRRRTP